MKRIVVCDTGPLLHLSEAGAIHLLQNTGRILIPKIVIKEFNQNAQGWNPPQWIEVHKISLLRDLVKILSPPVLLTRSRLCGKLQ